jgi:thioredoxin-like negative regulator of GroEL
MKYLDLKLLVVFILILIAGSRASGQEFIGEDNFKDKIAKDIVAVEFWVGWNSSNEFVDLSNLKDCFKYRVDIEKYPDLQAKYEVTCIPTVIIFESGEEKERFKANIMFELEADKKQVQKSINNIMLAKFN